MARARPEIGDRLGEAIALAQLGMLQASLGQTDLASEALQESLRVLREIRASSFEGSALELLGSVAEQRGEAEEARRFYEEALALMRGISHATEIASTLAFLGRLEVSRGEAAARLRGRSLPRRLPRLHNRERPAPP